MQFSVFFTEPKQRGKNICQGHGNALPCRKHESGSAAGGTAECAWEITARAGTDAGTVRRRNSGGRDVLFSLSETKNAQRTATGTPHIFCCTGKQRQGTAAFCAGRTKQSARKRACFSIVSCSPALSSSSYTMSAAFLLSPALSLRK